MIITDILVEKLRGEIMYWQKQALAASLGDDKTACHKALEAQGIAIDTLIKLVEANQPKR